MRIAIANWSERLVGGAEHYLYRLKPELRRKGCEIGLFTEMENTQPRRLPLRIDDQDWCISQIGMSEALAGLRKWRPAVIYSHGIRDLNVEAELLTVAPVVHFAHGYHGTCISGRKTLRFPNVETCERTFGPNCIVNFFPRRCGGVNPVTMFKDYRFQAARLANLKRCVSIITASEHMRLEYLKHGFTCPIYTLPIPADRPAEGFSESSLDRGKLNEESCGVNLLFVGRMVFEKGGIILLQALRLVANALGMKVNLCMVGDGPDKRTWVERARKLITRDNRVGVQFYGWSGRDVLDAAFDRADLLVVPSVWPEPFGMVGFEAGIRGLPAAGFAVGGIGEWLRDGINGHLASPAGDRAQSLANAIVECLRNADHYSSLRSGAREMAARLTMDQHATHLIEILEKSCGESRPL